MAGHSCPSQLRDKSSASAANKDAPRCVAQRAGGISCQCRCHCQRHIIIIHIRIRIRISIPIRVPIRIRIRIHIFIRIWIRIIVKVLLLNRWKSVLYVRGHINFSNEWINFTNMENTCDLLYGQPPPLVTPDTGRKLSILYDCIRMFIVLIRNAILRTELRTGRFESFLAKSYLFITLFFSLCKTFSVCVLCACVFWAVHLICSLSICDQLGLVNGRNGRWKLGARSWAFGAPGDGNKLPL